MISLPHCCIFTRFFGLSGDQIRTQFGILEKNAMANIDESGTTEHDAHAGTLLEDLPLEMLRRVDEEHDMNRIRAATALVNTFNYAIQVQAGRDQWQPSDYHRFIRALLALDSIGSEAIATVRTARLEADVRQAINGSAQTTQAAQSQTNQEQPQTQQGTTQEHIADVPQFLNKPQPSRQASLSSLPQQGNAIRRDGVITDDLRMPRRSGQ